MEGRCQCGAIRFTTPTPKPSVIYVCHCLECQRQSSSAFGLSLMFPTFSLPEEYLKIWTRTTFNGREKKCYFCDICGSRIAHHIDGQPQMTVKGCFEGLTRDMLDKAVHIWTKRAIAPIPEGAETWEEEPDGGTGNE